MMIYFIKYYFILIVPFLFNHKLTVINYIFWKANLWFNSHTILSTARPAH